MGQNGGATTTPPFNLKDFHIYTRVSLGCHSYITTYTQSMYMQIKIISPTPSISVCLVPDAFFGPKVHHSYTENDKMNSENPLLNLFHHSNIGLIN